jgi:WD40 repeat protein
MLSRNLGRTSMLFGMMALAAYTVAAPTHDKTKTDQSGDPLPWGALARMGTLRWRHGEPVTYVAFTADGKAVLTASRDNVIRLWDRATGKEIRRFTAKAVPAPVGVPGGMGAMGGFYSGGVGESRVALSKDGKVVAAIVGNAVIQLWEVETGKEIRQLKAPQGGANTIVFAPDGKSLAVRSFDRSTFVLETDTGKTMCQVKAKQNPAPMAVAIVNGSMPVADGLAFAPDSKTLATLEIEFDKQQMVKRHIKVTDIQTGNEIRRIDNDNVASVAYSPNGKILAFGSVRKIHLLEADTGKEIHQIDNKSPVTTLAFAHDGKSVAAKGEDNVVRLFETATGKSLHEMRLPIRAAVQANQFFIVGAGALETRDIAFGHDDKTLAVGGTQTLRFWSVATGKEQAAAGGHRAGVTAVLVAPDGKTMLSHGDDRVIRRWDARSGQELGHFEEPKGATTVAFAPDAQTVAVANTDGTIRLLAAADGKELHKFKAHADGLASLTFTPDSKTLASRGTIDNIIRLYDVAKGNEIKQMNVPVEKQPGNGVDFVVIGGGFGPVGHGFVFSPDGQTLAAYVGPNNAFVGNPQGQAAAKLVIWDVTTGKELRPITLRSGVVVTNLAYSPDGRLLAAQNADGTVSLWEIASGKERAILGEPQKVKLNPRGGGIVFATPLGTSGQASGTPAPLAFSRDGMLLAVRGAGNVVRVWQITHGKEIGQFKGHESAVNAVSFAADGKTLASASADTTLLVWDVTRLKREPRAAAELDAKEIETLWADLAGSDAIKAGKSIQALASAPKQSTPFLGGQLKPAAPIDVKKLTQWVADLNSGNFKARNVATNELEKLGELAIPALKKVLAGQPTLETQRRVESLLEKLTTRFLSPEQVRLVRAVEVLEDLATPEGRQILEALAQGAPGALPTRQAQTVLSRLPK